MILLVFIRVFIRLYLAKLQSKWTDKQRKLLFVLTKFYLNTIEVFYIIILNDSFY